MLFRLRLLSCRPLFYSLSPRNQIDQLIRTVENRYGVKIFLFSSLYCDCVGEKGEREAFVGQKECSRLRVSLLKYQRKY